VAIRESGGEKKGVTDKWETKRGNICVVPDGRRGRDVQVGGENEVKKPLWPREAVKREPDAAGRKRRINGSGKKG